ncbi:hypothetical protein Tco_1332651, partial [Tanacetum coccineum]
MTIQQTFDPYASYLKTILVINDLKWDINWIRSCADVVAFSCDLNLLLETVAWDNVANDDDPKCWPDCCHITRRTGRRAGSGGGRTKGYSGDQVPDFSTIIAQQLQNLLPTIVAQVGDQGRGQGNGRNQNGNAVNDNIWGDVCRGCTYKDFLAYNPKEYDGKGGAIV